MNRPGRPMFYEPEFADQPHKLCLMGAANPELAGAPADVANVQMPHAGGHPKRTS
jgi:hypothetical protein